MYTREQAEQFAKHGLEIFQHRSRELLASFDGQQVVRALVAFTRLHHQEAILEHVTSNDADPKSGFRFFADHLDQVFLTLFDQGKIKPEVPITDLGQAALDEVRANQLQSPMQGAEF